MYITHGSRKCRIVTRWSREIAFCVKQWLTLGAFLGPVVRFLAIHLHRWFKYFYTNASIRCVALSEHINTDSHAPADDP